MHRCTNNTCAKHLNAGDVLAVVTNLKSCSCMHVHGSLTSSTERKPIWSNDLCVSQLRRNTTLHCSESKPVLWSIVLLFHLPSTSPTYFGLTTVCLLVAISQARQSVAITFQRYQVHVLPCWCTQQPYCVKQQWNGSSSLFCAKFSQQ